jgi:hypothetical protein
MLWEESWLRHSTPVQSMKSARSTCPRGTCTGVAGAAGAGAGVAAPAAAVLAAAMGWLGLASRSFWKGGRAGGGEGKGGRPRERGRRCVRFVRDVPGVRACGRGRWTSGESGWLGEVTCEAGWDSSFRDAVVRSGRVRQRKAVISNRSRIPPTSPPRTMPKSSKIENGLHVGAKRIPPPPPPFSSKSLES